MKQTNNQIKPNTCDTLLQKFLRNALLCPVSASFCLFTEVQMQPDHVSRHILDCAVLLILGVTLGGGLTLCYPQTMLSCL